MIWYYYFFKTGAVRRGDIDGIQGISLPTSVGQGGHTMETRTVLSVSYTILFGSSVECLIVFL